MTLTDVLLDEAGATYAITERLFRRVRDEQLAWTPPAGRNWMTMGQLLMHCAAAGCGRAARGFVTGEWPTVNASPDDRHAPAVGALPSVASVAQAVALLADDRDLAMKSIRAAGESALLERMIVAPWGGPAMPLFQQLLHTIAHLSQHKGQLFYYLKLLGEDVTTPDLWSARAPA
jgi:uncharacterized damage-inducible protein DinB